MRTVGALGAMAVWLALSAGAQEGAARAPVEWRAPVQDKNFYLLSAMKWTPELEREIRSEARLAGLAAAKRAALKHADEGCGKELACYTGGLEWKDGEISAAAGALRELYSRGGAVRKLVDGPLRRSGMFQRYHSKPGDELLAQAWEDAARGINNIIEVYGNGRNPRYPAIDSISYDVTSASYLLMIRTLVAVLDEDSAGMTLFFQPSLRFAMGLLDANHRDEAGRLEPLEAGENREAVRRIASMDWGRYPYSVIVVPGSGTDRVSFHLSAIGKLRLELAVRRYRQGRAPLILVSGGYVHPAQTPFAEAMEMKKSLMTEFGVPGDAILVEPHARHTTTNLRNAGRQMWRYGIPFDKPALITTDTEQSSAIESQAFSERCVRELGYVPVRLRGRVSRFDLEFVAVMDCLQADASDPLDP